MISAKAVSYTEGYRSGHNEAVLKTVWAHAHKGSNPFPSAKKLLENKFSRSFFKPCLGSSILEMCLYIVEHSKKRSICSAGAIDFR